MTIRVCEGELERIHALIWQHLSCATSDRRSEFRWMSVATIDDNADPQVRTVVLREADRKNRRVAFHTDVRSSKLHQLRAPRAVALHFYSRRHATQIRMLGSVHFPEEAERSKAWQSLHQGGRLTYAQVIAPGSPIADPRVCSASGLVSGDQAYKNFAVVYVGIDQIDWLELDSGGHRRAAFQHRQHGALFAQWLAP